MFVVLTLFVIIATPLGVPVDKSKYHFNKSESIYGRWYDEPSLASKEVLYFKKSQIFRIKETDLALQKNNKTYQLCEIDFTDMYLGENAVRTYYWMGSCKELINKLNKIE